MASSRNSCRVCPNHDRLNYGENNLPKGYMPCYHVTGSMYFSQCSSVSASLNLLISPSTPFALIFQSPPLNHASPIVEDELEPHAVVYVDEMVETKAVHNIAAPVHRIFNSLPIKLMLQVTFICFMGSAISAYMKWQLESSTVRPFPTSQ